jgi:hypothetical protein
VCACEQPINQKYKMRKVNNTYILVTKWKLFVPKRKTTPGQPNPGKPLFRRKS